MYINSKKDNGKYKMVRRIKIFKDDYQNCSYAFFASRRYLIISFDEKGKSERLKLSRDEQKAAQTEREEGKSTLIERERETDLKCEVK